MIIRREKFEQAYADAHSMPVETFHQYRMGDTYRLPGIAKCWRFWNMALDSVVVELPDHFDKYESGDFMYWAEDVEKAIEAATIKFA